jgi:hypothetical protein
MIAQLVDDLHEPLKLCEQRSPSGRQCFNNIGSPGSKGYDLIGSTNDCSRAIQAIQTPIGAINQVTQPWWFRRQIRCLRNDTLIGAINQVVQPWRFPGLIIRRLRNDTLIGAMNQVTQPWCFR